MKLNIKKKVLSVLAIALSSSFLSLIAQDLSLYKRIQAEYPDESSVVIKETKDIRVLNKAGKLQVFLDEYQETIYMDSRSGSNSEQSVDYSELEKITKIAASTFVPKGEAGFKEIKVKEFNHEDKISKSVFYDGGKQVSFLYPKLIQGSKTILTYTKEFEEIRLLPSFYFQRGIPVKEYTVKITAPSDVEIGWQIFNDKEKKIQYTRTDLGKNMVQYEWKSQNISKYKFESQAPYARHFIPHLVFWIKSYKINNQTQNVFRSLDDLYAWYYDITKNVNQNTGEEVKKVVDSLLAGETDELEKVKKIYYWVQDNVKYIAIEDGMGGFIPREAEQVCHRRYGDCKDMSSLMNNMMAYAGIKSYLTWIGSRRIPYSYSEHATPAVDDHMICTYVHNDRYYFLDATGQHIPFGSPTGFIQGKEALLRIDKDSYKVVKVPIVEASANQIIDTVQLEIINDKIVGSGVTRFSGFHKIDMKYDLSKGDTDKRKFLRDFYNKGNNKFLIDSYDVYDVKNRDKDLRIVYKFNIADYLKKYNDELYVNLNLNKDIIKEAVEPDRTLPIDLEFESERISVVSLKVPAGYTLVNIPDFKEFKNEKFGFYIKYNYEQGSVTLKEVFYSKILILDNSDFETWNSMIAEFKKAYNEVLTLKKNK